MFIIHRPGEDDPSESKSECGRKRGRTSGRGRGICDGDGGDGSDGSDGG